MTEIEVECKQECTTKECQKECKPEPKKVVTKRDIFRFNGERETAINLEHVTNMVLEGVKITFSFYTTAVFVDFETPEIAKSVFEQLLGAWVSEIK